MKNTRREYENKEYFEYLEESFYLIMNRDDGNEIFTKIQNKLKNKNKEIFGTVLIFYTGISLIEIKFKDELSRYSDFNKISELRETKKGLEMAFDKYLESLDKLVFLEAISEILYWIAKIEGKRQIKIHKDFLKSWYQWNAYLEKKNKNKREGQKIIEKLRLVIGDKVSNLEQINNDYLEEIARFKKGKKNIFVNIDYEIDISNSIMDNNLILPERYLGEKQDFRVIHENTTCVLIDDKTYTMRDYFDLKKDSIDENWLKSKDLLKQIIVIYLIKRCQNGDEYAFNKLFNLYKKATEKLEQNFIKYYQNIDEYDVKGKALSILDYLLRGDTPKTIYQNLDKGRNDKKHVDVLTKKPYDALKDSYDLMFNTIDNQKKSLIANLNNLEKNTKDLRNRSKNAKKINTKKEYYENIMSYSSDVLHKINFAPTLFALLNPLDMLNISSKYNKYLYEPASNRNLTVWLLGDGTGNWKGMIWQELSNTFLKRKTRENESYDEYENSYTENDSGIYTKNKIKDIEN